LKRYVVKHDGKYFPERVGCRRTPRIGKYHGEWVGDLQEARVYSNRANAMFATPHDIRNKVEFVFVRIEELSE